MGGGGGGGGGEGGGEDREEKKGVSVDQCISEFFAYNCIDNILHEKST